MHEEPRNILEKLLDETLDACFMEKGYRSSDHRKAVLKALQKQGYEIKMKKEQSLTNTDESNKIIDFSKVKTSLLTGPKEPSNNDWLSDMSVGTVFLCKPKPETPVSKIFLQEYIVDTKFEKSIKLLSNINEPEQFAVVDPIEFCKFFDMHEVLLNGDDSLPFEEK